MEAPCDDCSVEVVFFFWPNFRLAVLKAVVLKEQSPYVQILVPLISSACTFTNDIIDL